MSFTGNADKCHSSSPSDKCYVKYTRCSCDSEQIKSWLVLESLAFLMKKYLYR